MVTVTAFLVTMMVTLNIHSKNMSFSWQIAFNSVHTLMSNLTGNNNEVPTWIK